MNEMNKLIKEKVIIRDMGEEIILKTGQPAYSLYGDRTHLYIPWRCWLDWGENRHPHVRRLGHAPEWTGLLLTSSDGQVCCAAWVEQTLSAKTVKNLTWLLLYVPPDFEFQLGRAYAVSGHIHRMLKLGHWSIDDDDERLDDDADQGLKMRASGWRRRIQRCTPNTLHLAGV